MSWIIRRWWDIAIPRGRPKGQGVWCDGCDVTLFHSVYISGGYYCPRCAEEIMALKEEQ